MTGPSVLQPPSRKPSPPAEPAAVDSFRVVPPIPTAPAGPPASYLLGPLAPARAVQQPSLTVPQGISVPVPEGLRSTPADKLPQSDARGDTRAMRAPLAAAQANSAPPSRQVAEAPSPTGGSAPAPDFAALAPKIAPSIRILPDTGPMGPSGSSTRDLEHPVSAAPWPGASMRQDQAAAQRTASPAYSEKSGDIQSPEITLRPEGAPASPPILSVNSLGRNPNLPNSDRPGLHMRSGSDRGPRIEGLDPPARSRPNRGAGSGSFVTEPDSPPGRPPSDSERARTRSGGTIYLDGAQLGRWVLDELADHATRPSSGFTGFDPRATPTFPGPPGGA
jgi:hypothetical protein